MIKFTAPEERVIRSVTNKVTEKVTDKVTDRVTDKVTDKEQKLLTLLEEEPGYTMPQLADRLGIL